MFEFAFMQRALIASLAMAVLCPIIGIFLVLRRTSMIGDALAHASLAGVAGALAAGINPVAGAFVFSSACGVLIEFLRKRFENAGDLILTIVLALSVGAAATLITSGSVPQRAENFLFGSVLTVTDEDIASIAAILVAALGFLWRKFDTLVAMAYDEEAVRAAGVGTAGLRYAFALLTAAAVSAAIPAAGVLTISAMIALPVATALQLGGGFLKTLLAAEAVSLFNAVAGLVLAWEFDAAPGGLTALTAVAVLAVVMLAGRLRR